MATAKIAISIDRKILGRLDRLIRERVFDNAVVRSKRRWLKRSTGWTTIDWPDPFPLHPGKRLVQMSPTEIDLVLEGLNEILGT